MICLYNAFFFILSEFDTLQHKQIDFEKKLIREFYMYQEEKGSSQYKKINIQNLEPRKQKESKPILQQHLLQSIDKQYYTSKQVYCYQDSGLEKKRIIQKEGDFRICHFFQAFGNAYANHGDIVLVPDQIWIMISFYISKYIDRNAQKLRKKLVKHEGVKKLIVQEFAQTQQESLKMEKNWDNFFDQIILAIKKQSVQGVVEAFQCNFSTTNKIYKTISTSIIMNSMKQFFRYQRNIDFLCGINNVYMAGTRQDWANMIPKLQNLIQFDVDGKLKKYISHMKIILQNFLDTFDNKPNVSWWNTIMTTPQKRSVYFSTSLQIEGWILNFYGMYEKQVLKGFPQMNISVPIVLKNQFTSTQKNLELIADWVSVSKLDNKTYKPDVGVTILSSF